MGPANLPLTRAHGVRIGIHLFQYNISCHAIVVFSFYLNLFSSSETSDESQGLSDIKRGKIYETAEAEARNMDQVFGYTSATHKI
jgi:hypothetical protein